MKRFVAKLLPALIIVILFISMSAKAFLFDDSKENDSKVAGTLESVRGMSCQSVGQYAEILD